MKSPSEETVWSVVANIVEERNYGPGGKEKRSGTKHFRPGTKVYIVDYYPGGCTHVVAVGLQRKSRRFINVAIRVDWVENLRIKPIYEPAVLKIVKEDRARLTKELAEEIFNFIPSWQEAIRKDKGPGNYSLEGSYN